MDHNDGMEQGIHRGYVITEKLPGAWQGMALHQEGSPIV